MQLPRKLFVPFFGGPDDRLALDFAVQLCANPRISATVVRVTKRDAEFAPTGSQEKARIAEDERLGESHMQQNTTTIASVSIAVPYHVCTNADDARRMEDV